MMMRCWMIVLSCFVCLQINFSETKLTGAGSTFAYPAMAMLTKHYAASQALRINYQGVGSAAGINQLQKGTVDFAVSDKPLKLDQLLARTWIQIPVVMSGIVLIVHIEGVDNNQLTLNGPLLSLIYLGQLVYWDDKRIQELNPGLKLPHKRIITVHRADGSGTSFNFTHYLATVSPAWQQQVGVGTTVRWPNRYALGAKGNGGVASQVKLTKNSIGYVEYAYAEQEHIPMVQLMNREQQVVQASLASFESATKHAQWQQDKGYYLLLADQPGQNSWPIVAASFVLLPKKHAHLQALLKFFIWGTDQQGRQHTRPLGYVMAPNHLFLQSLTT